MRPVDAALRASRGASHKNRVAPTRHPVAKGLNAPSMALLPGFCNLRHDGIKRGGKIQIHAFGTPFTATPNGGVKSRAVGGDCQTHTQLKHCAACGKRPARTSSINAAIA